MSALLYLGVAVLLSALGIFVLWYRNRKPTSLESGIEEFQQGLRALGGSDDKRNEKSRRRTG
ncbi:MAG TPA: hypothetical protein VM345_07075 [Acidimicrobiales bacterium]|nr:hypothetical protein [Acidimicrobiales bacterium]